jgi:hypothetical protein
MAVRRVRGHFRPQQRGTRRGANENSSGHLVHQLINTVSYYRLDAIRPWYHRSWIFPRDPNFAEKAGRLLDLYAREWQGKALKDDEFVISADEKTSIQARRRKHRTSLLSCISKQKL